MLIGQWAVAEAKNNHERSDAMGMRFTKDTAVGTTMGTIGGLVLATWIGSQAYSDLDTRITGAISMASANAEAVTSLELRVEINATKRLIAETEREQRELQRILRSDPDNLLALDQSLGLEADLRNLGNKLKCLENTRRVEVCQ